MVRTYLIDGTALAYRAHFAFTARGDGLTTADGHPTSATYGFILSLRALLQKESPDCIAVAFDGPTEHLERTELFPEYKATREKAPDELLMQFDDVRNVVEGFGIPIIEMKGQEADDVIGTLARRCAEQGHEVFVVTADKDFMQLVDDDKIRLYDLRTKANEPTRIIGPDEVFEKFGVKPEQMMDLLALMGDTSDNIPGVAGVGPKTAAKLLSEHGTLDAVLAAAPSMKKSKLRDNLIENEANARLSHELVRIRTDLDLPIGPDDLGPPNPDAGRLVELFQRLEFRRYAEEFAKLAEEGSAVVSSDRESLDVRTVTSVEGCNALARRLREARSFVVEAIDGDDHDVLGLAFSIREGQAFYVALPPREQRSDLEAMLSCFREPIASDSDAIASSDLKAVWHTFLPCGIRVGNGVFDARLASYCIAPGIRRHDVRSLALSALGRGLEGFEQLTGTARNRRAARDIPIEELSAWAGARAETVLRLREHLERELQENDVESVYHDIELPLVPVLADMESRGITVSTDVLDELRVDFSKRLKNLESEIHRLAGDHDTDELNLASPQQVGDLLFSQLEIAKQLGRRAPKRTKTGQWATDAATLDRFGDHEIVAAILEWRRLSKLMGTYVDALPKLIGADGRIHTSFNQTVAATGRLSSEDPNLQNIPIRTEDGRQLRRAFVAGEAGWVIVSADYSQIELRILAHLSGDENLRKGFADGEDVHRRTASIVFGVLPQAVDTTLRSHAKVVNYGLVYGMGVSRLANETGMSQVDAKKFIDAYFRAMPKVKGWLDGTLQSARASGEVRTLFGRRRPIPEIHSDAARLRVGAENVAVNSPIQGTAADIVKRAMIKLHAELRRRELAGRMLLQVHDELVLECPEVELEETIHVIRSCMEGAAELSVPLDVDVGHGKSWLEAHG
ncbi:MAG: DNA polymerase I [Planctomycetes bacterium]|nr:DNA polymerase I [Planctomycetota bacterium]MCB9919008.1 DNA polymerase I [Planctomycetota bacterium]